MLKCKVEAFDKNLIIILNRSLIGKTPQDIIKSYINVVDRIMKNETGVKKLISTLPENITTRSITTKKSGILFLIENINTFTLMSGDLGLILTMNTGKDFPAKVVEDMKKNLVTINNLIMVCLMILNLVLKV